MCKKESWISCGIFGFARPVERFGVERYKSNSSKVCCLNTTLVTVNCISCHKKGKHVNFSVLDEHNRVYHVTLMVHEIMGTDRNLGRTWAAAGRKEGRKGKKEQRLYD